MNTVIIRITSVIFLWLALSSWHPIYIPTRVDNVDKKYLNADLYAMDTSKAKPVILIQTPYNKDLYHKWEQTGTVAPKIFDTINYNYVILDWRGFYSNKSKDSALYDRGLDGFDAVEWIAKQIWCNGKVGTWGGSALGEIQFRTAKENPPHLVCAAPYIKDFKTKYEDYFYGGVYRKEHVESLVRLGFVTEDVILSHPAKDLLWKSVEKLTDYPEKFNVPMLLASGWFDHYPGDVIRAFEDIQSRSSAQVRSKHKLIIGPWTHSGLGLLQQGIMQFPEAVDFEDIVGKQFFDYYLLGTNNGYADRPACYYFEMGTNEWNTYVNMASVPRELDTLYINQSGRLLFTPPPPKMSPLADPPDTIRYDPKEPSPTIGGARFNPFDISVQTGPQDISAYVEGRNDVLIYTSELNEEKFSINGSIKAELFVGSDRKDTDFGIRLCLVDKDKRSIILTQGIKRARFREGTSSEKFMEEDSIYMITIELEPIAITLSKGEQLRIDITSSDYPMFDINLNDGGELYKPGDTLIATNLIYRRTDIPSRIIIPLKKLFTEADVKTIDGNIQIAPNPSKDYIDIQMDDFTGCRQIGIYNSLGICVLKPELSTHINISDLNNGIYFLNIIDNSGANHWTKFIILR